MGKQIQDDLTTSFGEDLEKHLQDNLMMIPSTCTEFNLKSFSGDDFDGTCWEPLGDYREECVRAELYARFFSSGNVLLNRPGNDYSYREIISRTFRRLKFPCWDLRNVDQHYSKNSVIYHCIRATISRGLVSSTLLHYE